jgi:lysozyme
MEPSKDCYDLIKKYEGCQLCAYRCPAGVWTIGWGSTWHRSENRPVEASDVITQKQADSWLEIEVERVADVVRKMATNFTQGQLDALTSFAYNLGCACLASSTLMIFHRAGSYAAAAEEFKKWRKAGGKVLPGLVNRRNSERELYQKGVTHP